jgi:hypothetical protein
MISMRFVAAMAPFLVGCAELPTGVSETQPLDLASRTPTVAPVVIEAPPAASAPNIWAYCGYSDAWPGSYRCNDSGVGFGGT